ncbi:hypothetical protein ACOI1H_20720 [Loktanella sp. DJP18]|uniref:hypothetical protein n=1 Tax=Loktanella sp. DJP18 TaxID=3409788 RepID=UPI003BB4A503
MQDIVRNYTVTLSQITIQTAAQSSDVAVDLVLKAENAPFSAFISVYQDDPVPRVNARLGAPHGRDSGPLDPHGVWRADRVPLDEGGYDAGGAYWGLRPIGVSLYAVQDGMGNISFVDAPNKTGALQQAAA